MESARLSLIQTIAERLAHEIGNALVPLSTHQQLLPQKIEDPEFRASHGQVLADGVKRISRLSQQMLFLARETIERRDTISVASLIQEAFAEAQAYYPDKKARLLMEAGNESLTLIGNHKALKHALAEIQLNALQACPANPQVTVRCQQSTNGAGMPWLNIDIQDDGTGFSRDTLAQVHQPFFTTRNVGLGLGLTVARKITEAHQGKLEIIPCTNGQHGVVRFLLPLPAP
jgi:signal transduction histidine kinase